MARPLSLHDELIGRIRTLSRPMIPLSTGRQPDIREPLEVRAILFDVYGTLFMSGSGDIASRDPKGDVTMMAGALQAAGVKTCSAGAAAYAAAQWRPAIEQARSIVRQTGVDVPEIDLVTVWQDLLHEMMSRRMVEGPLDHDVLGRLAVEFECRQNPVWPMPDSLRVLNDLHQRGLVMGLVSNGQFYSPLLFEALLDAPLEALGFDPALCVWSYQKRIAKPSPMLWAFAVEALKSRYGIHPVHVVTIGNDMTNDVRASAILGCRTVLFAGDARSLRYERDSMPPVAGAPDRVITQLSQLIPLLDRAAPMPRPASADGR